MMKKGFVAVPELQASAGICTDSGTGLKAWLRLLLFLV